MDRNTVGMIVIVKEKGRLWNHYGVLDGYGNIIHVHKRKEMITKDPFYKLIMKSTSIKYIDDDFDTRFDRYKYIINFVNTPYKYNLFSKNCESWVNSISDSSNDSTQVLSLCKLISLTVIGYNALTSILTD